MKSQKNDVDGIKTCVRVHVMHSHKYDGSIAYGAIVQHAAWSYNDVAIIIMLNRDGEFNSSGGGNEKERKKKVS